MPREWTPEQREEASRRAKERLANPTAAAVEVRDIEPERNPAVFIAENENRKVETVDKSQDEDGNPVTTTHIRPGTIMMYKPLPTGGYEPRLASVSSISMLLRNGWRENCPLCNKKHIDKQGKESADPNLCSARPPVAVILCPVCRVRIYDNMPFEEVAATDDDPNVITPSDLSESTPEQRLIAARNLHLWVHHPRSAQERNIPPLPDAVRDKLPEVR